jgi:predicted  nucleic acid-binding Zn-ribbon protein
MQNIKTHIVVAINGESKHEADFKVIHIGTDRRKAREIYLANMDNTDFDFVGMSTLAGFKSRARPKIDVETRKSIAASQAKKQEEVIKSKAAKAKAAKEALGEAAIKAEAEEEAAREKLDKLVKKSGASVESDEPQGKKAPSKKATSKKKSGNTEDGADALLK